MSVSITSIDDSVPGCVSFARLRRAIDEAARLDGLYGDCLASDGFCPGTSAQESMALDIHSALPADILSAVGELAHRMTRALVLTHHDEHDAEI